MATLFLFLVGSLVLQRKSLHQVDLFARQKEIRRWVGSDRYMVASDSTFERVLPRMDLPHVREELQQAYRLLRQEGHGRITLPGGRMIRAAAVDGSALGGRYASALEILGEDYSTVIDVEPAPNRGKELPASAALLRRAFARHGKGFVDIVLYDGLGITVGLLTLCRRKLGAHLLVKTDEVSTLSILKDAEAIFQAGGEFARDVEKASGVDLERGLAYEVWAASGFHHAEFSDPLKVARVRIRRLKGPRKGQTETFWVVTTDPTLSGEEMRELAHRRWSIENDGFRTLSQAVDSKHVWTRGKAAAQTFEVLMLVMFLALTLALAYRAHLDREKLWEENHLRTATLGYVAQCLLLSSSEAAGRFAPST